jgi:4-hydroxy-2-oxoglutarate aldolase
MLLEGLQLPLTTPFSPDGRLNFPKLEYNVARYSRTPAAGLAALSGCGEPTMLSDDEARDVLRVIAESAPPEKVLMAGVSRDSVAGTLDLAAAAARFGYDAILVKSPSLFHTGTPGLRTKELLTYFRAVADRSPLPLVLSSGKPEYGAWLPVEMVVELSGHTQIIGLVDAAGGRKRGEAICEGTASVQREMSVTSVFAAVTTRMQARSEDAAGVLISATTLGASTPGGGAAVASVPGKSGVKIRRRTVGFQVLAGSTTGLLEGLRAGAVGAMPAFAAAAPQGCYEVLAAWKDGDERLAEEKQARLMRVAELVEEKLGVPGIKFGSDLNGYFGGAARLPLLPLTGTERTEVEALMHGLRH